MTTFGLDNGKVVVRPYIDHSPIGQSSAVWPADYRGDSARLTNSAAGSAATTAKTDGTILVTLQDRALHVVDVSRTGPAHLATLPLPGQYSEELLLSGDRVLVVGILDDPNDASLGGPVPREGEPLSYTQHGTVLTLVDLADPKHPAVVSTEHILGDAVGAWLEDGVARVVVSSHPVLNPVAADDPTADTAFARNKSYFRAAPAEAWLPHRRILDSAGKTITEGPLLDCADVRRPDTDSGASLTSVVAVDLARADAFTAAAPTTVHAFDVRGKGGGVATVQGRHCRAAGARRAPRLRRHGRRRQDHGRSPLRAAGGALDGWPGHVATSAPRLVDLTRPTRPVVRGVFPGLDPTADLVPTGPDRVLGIDRYSVKPRGARTPRPPGVPAADRVPEAPPTRLRARRHRPAQRCRRNVAQEAWWSGDHATSVLPLGNRLATVYNDDGVALVYPDTLRKLGAVAFPSARRR